MIKYACGHVGEIGRNGSPTIIKTLVRLTYQNIKVHILEIHNVLIY